MRKLSEAQAPKSMFLQRALQNGRYTLLLEKMLSPAQLGQATILGDEPVGMSLVICAETIADYLGAER